MLSRVARDELPEEAVEPPSPHDARVLAAWAADRRYLLAVAAGMLKRHDGAEDVVQEAFARLAAAPPDAIEDIRGWLVVVTRRLCLDRLDLADNRRTTLAAEPPEPRDAPGRIAGPADWMMLHDEVGQAFVDGVNAAPPDAAPLDVIAPRLTRRHRFSPTSAAPTRARGSP
jgi:DNA-directed RNA polymerase specialized sigma24 family protein